MAGRESRPISHSGDAIFREGFYAECKDLLAANRIQSIDIGQGRRLYDLGLGDFLIGYHSQEAMIADQEAFSRIELTPSPALQSPDIWTGFSHGEGYYLPLAASERLEGPTDTCFYKGIIVSPQLFLARWELKRFVDLIPTRVKGLLE